MTPVKVCGITRPQDAVAAADLGARLIGLNFWPERPRYLEPAAARDIAEAVRGRVKLVGVFVRRPPREVADIDALVGLDLLQFHGDEPPEEVRPWGRRAIKVVRVDGESKAFALEGFEQAWGFLFDVRHPDYGGTGQAWDYSTLGSLRLDRPFLLAGGVSPHNARRAAAESGAWGLDICSGVESSPGVKSLSLMKRLFEEISDGQN